MKGAVFKLTAQVAGSTFTPGVPGREGSKKPLGSSLNWLLLKFSNACVTGSMVIGTAEQLAIAGVLKIAARLAAERSAGKMGNPGLLICVPGDNALRWRVSS